MTFEDDERAFLERMFPDRSKEQERFQAFVKRGDYASMTARGPLDGDPSEAKGTVGRKPPSSTSPENPVARDFGDYTIESEEPVHTGTDTVTKAGGTEMADRRFGAATGLKVRADSKAEDAMSRGDDAKVRSEGAKADAYGRAADQALEDMNSDESLRREPVEKSEGAMAAGGSNAAASDSGAFNTRYSSKRFDDFVSTPLGSPRDFSDREHQEAPDHPGAPDVHAD